MLALVVESVTLAGPAGRALADEPAASDPGQMSTPDYGPAEAQTLASARMMAWSQNRRIEALSERTDDTSTYANPDGSLTTETYAGPVRVKQDDGSWADISTDLTDVGDRLQPEASTGEIAVSDGGDKHLAAVSEGSKTFGIGWKSALPEPTVDGNVATYDLGSGVSLTVEALAQGFEQSVVLDRAPTGPLSYRIPLTLTGLALTKDQATRHLLLKDTAGKLVAEAPAPRMWDSSFDRASGDPAHQAEVDTSIETGDDGTTLVITPDPGFFTQDLTYPVTIDPSSTLAVTTDTWVQNPDYPDSQQGSQELKSGTYDAGSDVARSYVKFNVAPFAGKHITSATMSLYSYYSSTCATSGPPTQARRITSALDTATITWGSQPSTTTSNMATNTGHWGYDSSCPANWSNWSLTGMVQDWADGAANNGIQVRSADEANSTTWRRFRSANYATSGYAPKLVVNYNSYPGTATLVAPASGTATSDTTPTLSAKATDADTDQLRYTFEVWDNSQTNLQSSGSSGVGLSGATGSWTSAILPTGTYKWRAKADDGTDTSTAWSVWNTLVVDSSAPAAPTITSTSHASPSSWYPTGSFTGTLSATDTSGIAGYAVSYDQSPTGSPGTAVTQTSTALSTTGRADGTWYVHAAVKNKAGLWSATRTFAFHVDTTAPGTPTVSSSTHPVPGTTYPSRLASFTWTAPDDSSGIAAYALTVDQSSTTIPGTTTTQTGTSYSTTVTADGTWYLHVRTKDKAGNWSAGAAHFAFTVNASAVLLPTIGSTTHPDQSAAYPAGALNATWSTVGTAAGYSYQVDSTTETVPDTTVDTTTPNCSVTEPEGTWYLHVRAVDASGVWGPAAHYRFTVDTTAPAAPTVGSTDYPTDAWTGDSDLPGTFTITSKDARLAKVSYTLDNGTTTVRNTSGATTAVTLTPATTGSHHLSVTATDTAGNVSAATTYTFHVGTAGLTSPLSGEEEGHIVTLVAAGPADLTGTTFQYRRADGDAWTTIDASTVTYAFDGTPVTWPVGMTAGQTSALNWNTDALTAEGDLQIRAVFTGPDSPAPSEAVTVDLRRVATLDPGDTGALLAPTVVQSAALDSAQDRADASPDTLAPPYLDQDTGDIVAPVTTAGAMSTAVAPIEITDIPADLGTDDDSVPDSAEDADGSTTTEDGIADAVTTTDATVTPDSEIVTHSQSELDSVADEILTLDDVSGATAMDTAWVDAQRNRVVVTVPAKDDALADQLGERYGTETVAVEVNPGSGTADNTADRAHDASPFKGGAEYYAQASGATKYSVCTTGFAWSNGSSPYILSAGHCLDQSKDFVYFPTTTDVGYAVYDNYNSSGSIKFHGQDYWSGDLSLIKLYAGTTSARIYKGGSTSSGLRRVANRWTTRSQVGEQFCTGGRQSGEVCGWKVTKTRLRVKYKNGSVAHNVTEGSKNSGKCVISGDSGGPVYTVLQSGNQAGYVYAKGVISGGNCSSVGSSNNSDHDCSDLWDAPCTVDFTDIALAEKALPGGVKKW
ncbi:DNRLRE domain-containing protein [Streptomyces sp. NPDC090499]|uniref:DNRLRE domain-containing protein n=1 Tax=Streptomyces sp. NPDC090499 TaxID=3365965 RepID=UPI00380159CD